MAFSSGIIWYLVIYAQNKATNKSPPIILKKIAREHKILVIPRYIGFLENVKMPLVTKDVAWSGCNGFIVVLFFLNAWTAEIKINNPVTKKDRPRIVDCLNSKIGNAPLEK